MEMCSYSRRAFETELACGKLSSFSSHCSSLLALLTKIIMPQHNKKRVLLIGDSGVCYCPLSEIAQN